MRNLIDEIPALFREKGDPPVDWANSVHPPYLIAKTAVLSFIEPVDPESIKYNGQEVDTWEALWCPPMPMLDIDLLRAVNGVTVIDDDAETDLGGWRKVVFKIDYNVMLPAISDE